MSSKAHVGGLRVICSALVLATFSPVQADIRVRGGSVIGAFPSHGRCGSQPGDIYMPLRVYGDVEYTAEIDSVLAQNKTDGADRAEIPIAGVKS